MIETPDTIYEYFTHALNYIIFGPQKVERKSIAKDADISVQYLGQILDPDHPTKASLKAQKKIASAAGYTYEEFLQLGKDIITYGGPHMGAWQLNSVYERLQEIMNALGINEDRLLYVSDIDTPKQSRWFLGDPPDLINIKKIAKATGFNKNWILTGTGKKISKHHKSTADPSNKTHLELIPKFKHKEWAERINSLLLEIEEDPDIRQAVETIIKAMADQARAKNQTGRTSEEDPERG